jgi:L-lysine 6-transaminase
MVRSQRYLEIIAEEKLVENAATQGAHLLAGLRQMEADAPELFGNARGLGLMCAIDLPDTETRSATRLKAYELGMLILPCGERSLRFRPPLDVTRGELDQALEILADAARHARALSA